MEAFEETKLKCAHGSFRAIGLAVWESALVDGIPQ